MNTLKYKNNYLKENKIEFHFHAGLMKNPKIRKKKEEWHPCNSCVWIHPQGLLSLYWVNGAAR